MGGRGEEREGGGRWEREKEKLKNNCEAERVSYDLPYLVNIWAYDLHQQALQCYSERAFQYIQFHRRKILTNVEVREGERGEKGPRVNGK